MSELKQSLTAAMKDAMRARDKGRLSAVRMMLAELKRVEIDERIELDDARILSILDRMLKQRRDSIAQFQAANREDLVEIERAELAVIQSFLPQALTEAEIEQLIDQAMGSVDASGMQAMGQVMALLKPKLQGRADLSEVSQRVKAKLVG